MFLSYSNRMSEKIPKLEPVKLNLNNPSMSKLENYLVDR